MKIYCLKCKKFKNFYQICSICYSCRHCCFWKGDSYKDIKLNSELEETSEYLNLKEKGIFKNFKEFSTVYSAVKIVLNKALNCV